MKEIRRKRGKEGQRREEQGEEGIYEQEEVKQGRGGGVRVIK